MLLTACWAWVGPSTAASAAASDTAGQAAGGYWAFRAPSAPSPPETSSNRTRNPIDAFVLNRLQANALAPSDGAAKEKPAPAHLS